VGYWLWICTGTPTYSFDTAFFFDEKGDEFRFYQFSIYNRWGELLFHTDDPDKGWDGSFNNKVASLGTYLYSVKAVGLDGKAHQKNGYVALIR
jgi:gliding motility-associated-like protein